MRSLLTRVVAGALLVLALGCGSGQIDTGPVLGGWRIPGETNVLSFQADGTFQWGPKIGGTYSMLPDQTLRMDYLQKGKPSGRLDTRFAISGDEMRLTQSDGAVTLFQRVK